LGSGSRLPLGLGRQPSPGPATIRLRLVPVDVQNRPVWFQRHPAVEVTPLPAVHLASPVDGVLGSGLLAPVPALLTPEVTAMVAAILDESDELTLGDRGAGNGERLQ